MMKKKSCSYPISILDRSILGGESEKRQRNNRSLFLSGFLLTKESNIHLLFIERFSHLFYQTLASMLPY